MNGRLLLCVSRYGFTKNYVRDALSEMMLACVRGVENVDVIWAGDYPGDEIQLPSGLQMVEDIVSYAREETRELAIENGYDKMLWQGMDALYRSQADFQRLISHDLPIVSALISGRTDVSLACARRWVIRDGSLTQCQDDVPQEELLSGDLVPVGWPSTDNMVIRSECFEIDVSERPRWYEQQPGPKFGNSIDENAATGVIEHGEWFCLEAARNGFQSWIDTVVRVAHVHESGAPDGSPLARIYPDLELPLSRLQEWALW